MNAFLPFCSVLFCSVPLKNGLVKFAVRKRSERSFHLLRYLAHKNYNNTHYKKPMAASWTDEET